MRANVIEKVFKYMEEKTFIRGQKVFQEGVTPIDGVYFIQEGDFEVTQKIDQDKTEQYQKVAKKAL